MSRIRETLSSARFWYLDFLVILLYGAGAGYEVQRTADSGEFYPEKVFRTALTGFLSYLIAFIFAMLWKRLRPKHFYWLSAAIFGSAIFAFFYGTVLFDIESSAVRSISERFKDSSVVFLTIMFAVPTLILLLLLRVVFFFYALRTK